MQKSPLLVTIAIIATAAMFVTGITPTHMTKAGSCSSSISSSGGDPPALVEPRQEAVQQQVPQTQT